MSVFSSIVEIIDRLTGRYVQKRPEYLRNKIKNIEKEIERVRHEPESNSRDDRLVDLIDRLSDAKEELANRAD